MIDGGGRVTTTSLRITTIIYCNCDPVNSSRLLFPLSDDPQRTGCAGGLRPAEPPAVRTAHPSMRSQLTCLLVCSLSSPGMSWALLMSVRAMW